MHTFEEEVKATQAWFETPRFKEITRLYSARQVVAQRGTIEQDYTVARVTADKFYSRLRALFANGKSITTFGPYSPGQAIMMKRLGIEGIYLGGWATSAKGSITENPGPDLASYPLSQVPDEAATIVRALLTADKNQRYTRAQMSDEARQRTPIYDYSPFIIADADTGHGGEAHVSNLIRRFVEVGVTGYHIEDQKPGAKKCGHQAGKVLVPQNEQNKRLNAARFQLDIMNVPGIIVARTDAESATFLDGRGDERDQPFILGATNVNLPSYKAAFLALLKRFYEGGIAELNGHLLYQQSDTAYEAAGRWLDHSGLTAEINQAIAAIQANPTELDRIFDKVTTKFLDTWQTDAHLKTYRQAVADVMAFHNEEGQSFEMSVEEWLSFAGTTSLAEAKGKARTMGITIIWDCEMARTPEGYYQIQGGIPYAVVKSLAAAPFADIIWMETKTANLEDAKIFAEAIHAVYPEKMLAYNLSPSFSWDTTGMSEEEMKAFPAEIGKLGYVFNFITYGGHQVDGLASEEFATALQQDGMLALARLQRKFRLLNSPYKIPQSYVGGPRLDGILTAASGRTATTKAMGKGSTQFQHLIQTEVPPSLLENWLQLWAEQNKFEGSLSVSLRPHTAGSELLELSILDDQKNKISNLIFSTIQDRSKRNILSVRDQHLNQDFRKKRLTTLSHLFLIHRYKSESVHYLNPTDDNRKQTTGMRDLGLFSEVRTEIGDIIVATVNGMYVQDLLDTDQIALTKLIAKTKK
ncbi:MAG: isocitrate lyase ICL2 [Chloroflexota bacterium]